MKIFLLLNKKQSEKEKISFGPFLESTVLTKENCFEFGMDFSKFFSCIFM